jgi:chromosome partitioning protein
VPGQPTQGSISKCQPTSASNKAGRCRTADNEELECQRLIDAVNALDRNVDFIVIDTPGTDSYLSRLAHSTADTLITPMNDSLLDFDVLGSVDPTTPQHML